MCIKCKTLQGEGVKVTTRQVELNQRSDVKLMEEHITNIASTHILFRLASDIFDEAGNVYKFVKPLLPQVLRCSACKAFYNELGDVVYLDVETGDWRSLVFSCDLHDEEINTAFAEIEAALMLNINIAKLEPYRRKAPLTKPKLSDNPDTVGRSVQTGGFDHFHVVMPKVIVHDVHGDMYERMSTVSSDIFGYKIPALDAVNQIIKAIEDEHLNAPASFLALQRWLVEFEELRTNNRVYAFMSREANAFLTDNVKVTKDYVHPLVGVRVGPAYAALVTYLKNEDFQYAMHEYFRMTHPLVFRRREAKKSTEESLARTREIFERENLMPHFKRRLATMEDFMTIPNASDLIVFQNPVPKELSDNPFDKAIADKQGQKDTDTGKLCPMNIGKPKNITFDMFLNQLLPRATEMMLNIYFQAGFWSTWSLPDVPVDELSSVGKLIQFENTDLGAWGRGICCMNVEPADSVKFAGLNHNAKMVSIIKEPIASEMYKRDIYYVLYSGNPDFAEGKIPPVGGYSEHGLYKYRADVDVLCNNYVEVLPKPVEHLVGVRIDSAVTFSVIAKLDDGATYEYTVINTVDSI